MNLTENNKYVKILPFIISILFFAILIFVYIKYPFLSVDEGYTRGLMNLSFMDMISITANDVHPPLYYLIAMFFVKICNAINLNFNIVHLMKFPSLIPYLIILIFSLTKIRKEYGILSAGFFSLTMILMSEFFSHFITARMYTWTTLFLVLSFFYVKDILERDDFKSWIMLSIFSVLGAYTHYFSALSSVVIYFLLFIWILFNKEKTRDNLKKFVTSIILCFILYIPWIPPLLNQLKAVHESFWIEPITLDTIINYFSYCLTISSNYFIHLISLVFILIVFFIFLKKFIENKNKSDLYLLMGISVFIGTLLLGLILSLLYKPILLDRYLLPSISIFWLCFSIKLGNLKFKNSTILIIVLLITIVGAFNVYHEINEIIDLADHTIQEEKVLLRINNNDSVIIYDTDNHYVRTHTELDKVYKQYGSFSMNNKTSTLIYKSPNVIFDEFVIPDDLRKFPDKNVYLMQFYTSEENFPDNVKSEKIGTAQHANIYKLKPV